ncbi:Transcriptional regulatory protein fixJ [Oligella urethralis]|uniref:response regulator transcription factor n=1 Tax=Oligella urethralis TaxID=90245 RepID=UPI000661539B|nr:response regulator [Oligella urethralis]AVL71834.1 DNA-binding response regulator [Oligella urethralis]PMC16445.1 DNA-binding response regulator [Oligella urethralis]SUA51932.1 Transcriptional regulatory protein fixJ [Oligella urethralis]
MDAIDTNLVFVIDDDDAFRRSLVFLLEDLDWRVEAFASAAEFLEACPEPVAEAGCILLDIRMPLMSGMELQLKLNELGWITPIIFLTGHGDIEMAVQAMKLGAYGFLSKPFKDQVLLDEVAAAVRFAQQTRENLQRQQEAEEILARLSPREKQVANLLARGQSNRLIAQQLDISEKTVHIHRQNVMEKAEISSAAELAHLMLKADPHSLD